MRRRSQGKRFTRRLVSVAVAIAVVTTGMGAVGLAAQAAPTDPAKDKIPQDLMSTLQKKNDADFWIHLKPRADLTAASRIKDWNARGTAVAKALKDAATASQAKLKAELDSKNVRYQAFWATNAIKVSGGSLGLAQSLAAHTEVDALYSPVAYKLPETDKGTAEHTVNAVEWGIANIKADQVWSQYGVKGAGIVVASIDSGVQYDHPALVNQYRGNNGDGTFNHNYNWFDAAGTCGPAPCDLDDHGTHTMGTMAGSDGANQIGVAPEVKWIAANGCCPSDAALISSGEWMLEPRDLNGNNPDASKRPNIINNSWGTTAPSNSPFMEEISQAWEASGIFGMWANGNSGALGCNSSGSPGSRIVNYSAGNYDINNNINRSSGRGVGQDGEIKPNISAPGTNVRSSIPGGYANFTGTSMASPHVAGTIALLWSASAALSGDVAATKALLDNTAVDKGDAECGGTTDDNNVYGEGRLDALALMNAAPIGDTGTLSGIVTKAADGSPLAGAQVTITGPADRQVSTGPDGRYSVLLPTGDYQVAVSAFGYVGQSAAATVTANATTTKDFALAAAPTVNVGGTVLDGGGHGWPLYAKVSVEGPGGVFDYTTPVNGRYSFKLPAGATYTVKTESQYPGYQVVTEQVAVGSGNLTHNVSVPVDQNNCTAAPGYRFGSDGVYETFDGTSAPAGWTVVDNLGNGQVWKFDDPGARTNLTGGSGGFAVIDSDDYGAGGSQNSSLVSPVVNLTGVTAPVIRFNQDHNQLADTADVDLSIDGGTTWTNVAKQTADFRGPRTTEIPIPQAANQAAVQVRFHYYNATFEWWWEVDNVLIGSQVTCVPTDGGLVVGNVKDQNTGAGINGAVVTSDDRPAETATTAATPDDTGLADGFYWMFSSLTGAHPFSATAGNYVKQTLTVDVEADWATQADFSLGAGRITVNPTAVSATVRMPTGKATKNFTVTNNGSAPVDLEFSEREGDFVILRADGTQLSSKQILAKKGAPLQKLSVPTSFAAKPAPGKAPVPAAENGPSDAPWTAIASYPNNVMDNRVVNVDGKVYSIGGSDGTTSTANSYVYDPVAQTWTAIAPLPGARNAMAIGVVDGQIVATGGWAAAGPDAGTWAYDPGTNAWTAKAANPAARSGAAQAVAGGKMYAIGGCTTSACTPMSNSVTRYDLASNTWETMANYPIAVAFASCGAVDDTIYCTGGNNGTAGVATSYAYDTGSNTWSPIPNAPSDSWAASFAVANGRFMVVGGVQGASVTNAGFAFDPAAGTWSALPNANQARYRGGAACGFYKVGGSSGGFTSTKDSEVLPGFEECAAGAADVSWLSIDKTSATLQPGQKVTVAVTMTANVDQPGTYTAGVAIKENTPYTVPPVGVTMNVNPPASWGKLMGTVTGTSCQGASAPIPGATVQVDSWAQSFTFTTDPQGKYAYWLDKRNNPLTMIAAKDGWKPQTRTTRVNSTTPTVENFDLKPVRC